MHFLLILENRVFHEIKRDRITNLHGINALNFEVDLKWIELMLYRLMISLRTVEEKITKLRNTMAPFFKNKN